MLSSLLPTLNKQRISSHKLGFNRGGSRFGNGGGFRGQKPFNKFGGGGFKSGGGFQANSYQQQGGFSSGY
ncbi:unnamed protein product [Acanthoscelides obtectus]|uniref:Uncharacterized protein n=1 Tax=Acanthoscelides obtectus TaxID=200917 RepID=A0A9P0PBS5_ACAOB|nr:unnamed protein product [Acanthoscelides obtectus]CAK1675559.1 hypothetical protein AOBTE_LOCUS30300 [Acanthoscelides obtectus]